ncbi:MAG: tRNA (adenosine(37)-N6)-dimethylallyltransferase MiaA [Bacteroidales bacterium]|nr:tRNA (adenosine(37)-N6)-dimethylallyltransferase MiaA [Bacteroidales bacterium]
MNYDIITILGPTASGKTTLASNLASKLNAEIISGDSRQVYRGMDIGTGKDLIDYVVGKQTIPHHLIDIVDAGCEYNVFEYKKDFYKVFNEINHRKKIPILCGGSGMYIESVLSDYRLIQVPENLALRDELEIINTEKLVEILSSYGSLHNVSDTSDRRRLIRAIEIQQFYKTYENIQTKIPPIKSIIFGIDLEREEVRNSITKRLNARLQQGMIEEIKALMKSGLSSDQIKFYGLEYKFLTSYVKGELSYDEMFRQLNTAIHQFAKRQMTWFRRMEKKGFKINWIDGKLNLEAKIEKCMEIINSFE